MASFIDRFIQSISSGLVKRQVADYILPEQAYNEHVIDLRDGSQLTMIKVIGMQVLNGEVEFEGGIESLNSYFYQTLRSAGMYDIVVFERDPDFTPREIDSVLMSMSNTSKILGMDISDIISDRRKMLLENTVYESCYIACITTAATMLSEAKNAFKRRAEESAEFSQFSRGDFAPNYFVHLDDIDNYHRNHVENLKKALSTASVSYDVLDVESACSALGFQLERSMRSPNWRPRVGSIPDKRIKTNRKVYPMYSSEKNISDPSYLIQLPISDMLTANDHDTVDANGKVLDDGFHRQGDLYYCTMVIRYWPDNITSFSELFATIGRKIPYRIAYYIDSNKDFALAVNKITRSIVTSWGNRRNPIAREQTETMQQNVARNTPYYRFRGQITTWGKSKEELKKNVKDIGSCLSKWGSAEGLIYSPNPMQAFASSCIGACYDTPAPGHYAPGKDIAQLLPFTRPASLWSRGSAQFTTHDGRLWTYKVVSEEMENNNILTTAKPRSGKSVALNNFDFSLVFQEGMTRLPRILTVDSAPSSRGKIEMLYDRLPEHLKEQVKYYRPSNSRDSEKINVLTLPLGLKYPLPEHMEFLEAFVTQISMSIASSGIPENIPEIVRDAINKTYERAANINDFTGDQGKLYLPGIFPEIDAVIAAITPPELRDSLNVINGKTQIHWYEVRDLLFKANHISLAKKAQMAASPILPDLANVLVTDSALITKWGPEILRKVSSYINSAMQGMPMIDSMSNIDFDSVRILSFDCGDFAKSAGLRGERQSTLIYMVALFTGTQSFFYHPDIAGNFEPLYKNYADKLISECMEDVKRVNVDEYWKVKGLPGVDMTVQMLFRVGPKFRISNLLASQDLDDYSPAIIKAASGFIFLGKPKESEIASIRTSIGLSETAINLLNSNSFGGVPGEMLFVFDTKRGRFYHHLFLKMGKTELWANSSTNQDVTVRRMLIKEFGQSIAYKILAKDFPSGNCDHQLKLIQEERGQTYIVDEATLEDPKSPEYELAKKVIKKYREMMEEGIPLPFDV